MFRDGLAKYGANLAALKIQKFTKGYLVAKKYEPIKIQRRLYDHFEYFNVIKKQQMVDSQIFIAYMWRKRQKKIEKEKQRQKFLEKIELLKKKKKAQELAENYSRNEKERIYSVKQQQTSDSTDSSKNIKK